MLSKVNSQISSKFVAAISKHIVPFRSMLRNSNNECRDKVATWGLDHLFPPSSTSSSNLIHLKNCKIRIIIADTIGIKIRSEFQTKKGLPSSRKMQKVIPTCANQFRNVERILNCIIQLSKSQNYTCSYGMGPIFSQNKVSFCQF